jgi:glycosyltransferase involved in cell wall biosynthesis
MVSLKVNIIVQRFHPQIVGGAEYHSYLLAKALKARGFDVTILTTTSKDHMKWDDSYSPGEDSVDGLKVIRFKPRIPRLAMLLKGIKLAIKLAKAFKLPASMQSLLSRGFMVAQGPYVPELKAYLGKQSDVLNIFYCYLYYPAVECSKVCSHFILIPTAHDEFALYLKGVEDLMRRASLLLLQTEAEKQLIEKTFLNTGALKVGAFGFNSPEQLKFTSNPHTSPELSPYFFFAGRIGPGKDIPTLIDFFSKINRTRAQPYKLYLAGSLESNYVLPELPWVKYLGLISDELKFDYISGALAVVNPSKFESLSILALEALVMGRPLIVNRNCDVLREYSTWSPLCLTFEDQESLNASIIWASGMLQSANFNEIGLKTKTEVLSRFNWDRTAQIITDYAHEHGLV